MENRTRLLTAGGLILLLAGAGSAWAVAHYRTPQGAAPAATVAPISVTALQSAVSVRGAGTDTFLEVPGHATTTSGATIRTSPTGRALVESAAAHATLIDYSSQITLAQETGNRTQIGLESGTVWSRIQKVFDSGEYYEITSQNAIAAVRGTSFSMSSIGSTTTLIVVEGSVAFSAVNAQGVPIPGSEVLVMAGHTAVRVGQGGITVHATTMAETEGAWYQFNNPKDEPAPGSIPSPAAPAPTVPGIVPPSPPTVLPPASTPPAQSATAAPEPHLASLSPSSVDEGSTEELSLRGRDLGGVVQLKVGGENIPFDIKSATEITFAAKGLAPGTYSIVVVTRNNFRDQLSNALTVIDPNATSGRDTYNPNYPS